MTDHSTSFVDIRGDRLQVMRGGTGDRLVVLHGAGGAAAWLPYMEKLAQRFDVIVPQHPGFGGSKLPDWLETVVDLANFYLDFLDQLDLRNAHLVGFSLGGWIAAELAIRNASRLATLTLVGAAGLHLPGVPQVDIFARSEEQAIRELFHDQTLADDMVKRVVTPDSEDIRLSNQLVVARLAWQPRFHDPQLAKWLHRIRVPTLVVWGEQDRLFPKEYAAAYQRLIPGARSVIIPHCGHLPEIEKTDAFVSAVESFCAKERVAA